jgi:hypothetical protein
MKKMYFNNSENFLSKLTPEMILEVYGDLSIETLDECKNISNVLIDTFGDYIVKAKQDLFNVFISSSAASLSFIFKGEIYTEEEMIILQGYSREYLKDIENLGKSYAPKNKMFGYDVVTLLPGCILIIDQDGKEIQNTSWYDMLLNKPDKFSLKQMKSSAYKYFKNKKTFLLTSGGVDTAVLINILKNIKDISYASYYFEYTGGNNTPENARELLDTMYIADDYRHDIYQYKSLHKIDKKIYGQDVDFDLMKRLNLIDTKTYVACGQSSDSIIAPGFVKSDSLISTFKNWGFIGGVKSMVVNAMLVFFRWNISRIVLKTLFIIPNIFLKLFSDKVIDYSVRGFYYGLFNTVPFIYSKNNINQELEKSFKNINKLFLNEIKDDSVSLILLRIYSKSVYAMQNQRGVETKGYKYLLPFHSAYFIGYCFNRKFSMSEIWKPKEDLIKFLHKEGFPKDFLFYRRDRKTGDIINK